MRVSIVGISSQLGLEKASGRYEKLKNRLGSIFDVAFAIFSSEQEISKKINKIKTSNLILATVLTGGTEHLILKLTEANKPIILLTTMYYNSFSAAIEAVSELKEIGYRVMIFNVDDEENIKLLQKISRALKNVLNKNILLIGGPSPWLVYSKPNPMALKERFKMILKKEPIEVLIAEYNKSDPSPEVLREVNSKVSTEVKIDDFEKVAKIHSAIKNLLKKIMRALSQ